MIPRQRWQEALDIQNACNLSGLVHTFPAVMADIWDEARELGQGTDDVNRHPIVLLWLDKLNSLAGLQCFCDRTMTHIHAAYDAAREALQEE